jgi:hypothetical protein
VPYLPYLSSQLRPIKMPADRTETGSTSTDADSTKYSSQASTLTPLTARQKGKRPVTDAVDSSSRPSIPPRKRISTAVNASHGLTFNDGRKNTWVPMAPGTKQFSVITKVTRDGKLQSLTEFTESRDGGMQHRNKEGFWGDLTTLPNGDACVSQGNVTYGLSDGKWNRI